MSNVRLMVAACCILFSLCITLQAAEKTTNVILLLVDDMGYGDIAAHGNPIIKTPNFDALHENCARFTNFAVSPSCAPTRAALLTGKHEFLSSVTHTIKPMREMNLQSATPRACLYRLTMRADPEGDSTPGVEAARCGTRSDSARSAGQRAWVSWGSRPLCFAARR